VGRSIGKLQAELDLPLKGKGAQHLAKVCRSDVAVRVAEIRVVKQIKELAAELDSEVLADVEVFIETEIPVGE
jgi:hypothetical protein